MFSLTMELKSEVACRRISSRRCSTAEACLSTSAEPTIIPFSLSGRTCRVWTNGLLATLTNWDDPEFETSASVSGRSTAALAVNNELISAISVARVACEITGAGNGKGFPLKRQRTGAVQNLPADSVGSRVREVLDCACLLALFWRAVVLLSVCASDMLADAGRELIAKFRFGR